MTKTNQSKTDKHANNPHEHDARLVAGPKARAAVKESSELDAAWLEWSRGVQSLDEKLKEAFAAGWNAGRTH